MKKLMLGLGISVGRITESVTGLIWRNWTTGWTSLNNTWNTYN
jgi:hypothetical protein